MKFLAKIGLVSGACILLASQSQPVKSVHVPGIACDSSEVEHRIYALNKIYDSKIKKHEFRHK